MRRRARVAPASVNEREVLVPFGASALADDSHPHARFIPPAFPHSTAEAAGPAKDLRQIWSSVVRVLQRRCTGYRQRSTTHPHPVARRLGLIGACRELVEPATAVVNKTIFVASSREADDGRT